MSDALPEDKIAELMERFKAGRQRWQLADLLENNEMVMQAAEVLDGVCAELDALGPDVRERVLTPYLDDPDPHLRSHAAGCLIEHLPERCMAIFRELSYHDDYDLAQSCRATVRQYDWRQEDLRRERENSGRA
jgi:hypothetical protein